MHETAELAEFVASTGFDDLPDDVVAKAKQAIRDEVAVTLASANSPEADVIVDHVMDLSPGDTATVMGRGAADPESAALANGVVCFVTCADDAFESILIHPSITAVPAALAAAEYEADRDTPVSGRDVLAGYVAGVETVYRTGHSVFPTHYHYGWHLTGTVGTFSAAAAAGSVLGLSTEELRCAFGLAATCSSALTKNFGTGGEAYHPGHSAQSGLRAAMLARRGMRADPSIFEGERGWGRVMTPGEDDYDPDAITAGLGKEWAVREIGYKLYPSDRLTHIAIEEFKGVVEREDLAPGDVERIEVTLSDPHCQVLVDGLPEDIGEARFSIVFPLAAVLRWRSADIEVYTEENIRDPATRELMERIEVEGADLPTEWAGRVAIETTDGEVVEGVPEGPLADYPPGHAEKVADERLRERYHRYATRALSADAAEVASRAIDDLDDPGALARLAGALRGSE